MSDATGSSGKPTRLVCFGDSVTQGVPHCALEDTFVALLERRLNMRYQPSLEVSAVNAGVGGENSCEGLARIQPDVLAHEPALVAIEFGLNDIRYEPEKMVSEEQFAANLREMHHVYSQNTDYYAPWGGCDGLNAVYAETIRQVARELRAPLCDIYAAFVKEAVKSEFRGETFEYRDLSILSRYISSQDGVHPTAAGQEFIAGELYAVIVQHELLAPHA
jgi:lysophospholipase L1-like esterase